MSSGGATSTGCQPMRCLPRGTRDSVAPCSNTTGEGNEQAALVDRCRDVCGGKCPRLRRVARWRDGQEGRQQDGEVGQDGQEGKEREESQEEEDGQVRQDGKEVVTRFKIQE